MKKLLKDDKLIIGKDLTLKGLREGKLSKVYMASNCPEDLKEDIQHYAEIAEVEVEELSISNSELGDICKRPHYIAVMGVRK
ncbi:TPA: 50S ribosomal protein L30 [Candidatus Woesearchaeota archaeon]|nr:50S ribosomal protein L30 [Candidatus Woesearchaeota archaeon]